MLEKEIEKKLVTEVKKRGGMALKFNSESLSGIPDRIVLMPNSKIAFIELKRRGAMPRPLQYKRIRDIRKLGFKCYVVDDEKRIGGVIDEIQST